MFLHFGVDTMHAGAYIGGMKSTGQAETSSRAGRGVEAGSHTTPVVPTSPTPRRREAGRPDPSLNTGAVDAEQFRMGLLTFDWPADLDEWGDIPEAPMELALHMDRGWTMRAIRKGRANEAAMRAMNLAHAAFRACPGLRED